MSGWKKKWNIRAAVEDVQSILKAMPRIYVEASADGLTERMGRTFGHQRRDFKPKVPKWAVDKPGELVFQHDLVSPLTYKLLLTDDSGDTEVSFEVKTSATAKDSGPAEQICLILYSLSKSLEISQWTQPQ